MSSQVTSVHLIQSWNTDPRPMKVRTLLSREKCVVQEFIPGSSEVSQKQVLVDFLGCQSEVCWSNSKTHRKWEVVTVETPIWLKLLCEE
ncbi:MAG: hypothetical protein MK364_01825 [Pirellulales bacterium]|nr:hypothetical protein [Pirellulales bacterium]